MLMNAVTFHYYLWVALKRTAYFIAKGFLHIIHVIVMSPLERRRVARLHKEHLQRIDELINKGKEQFTRYMLIDCIERLS
jgi:hypothetical protein